jgi:hypothetical protein
MSNAQGSSPATLARQVLHEVAEPDTQGAITVRPEGRQLRILTNPYPEQTRNEDDESTKDVAKRKEITAFSEASRRRLRQLVHSLKRNTRSKFLTLTWHEHCPTPEEAKNALDVFFKRMKRRFPQASAVWKMEPQERGFPHFHLFVYGLPNIPYQKLSRIWHECTQEVSDKHRKSGVDVMEVGVQSDDGRLQVYLSKYFAKESYGWPTAQLPPKVAQYWERPGRFWGVWNRSQLPVAAWSNELTIPKSAARWLIRKLVEAWDMDLPEGVIPPSMTINTRGDPMEYARKLLKRVGQ